MIPKSQNYIRNYDNCPHMHKVEFSQHFTSEKITVLKIHPSGDGLAMTEQGHKISVKVNEMGWPNFSNNAQFNAYIKHSYFVITQSSNRDYKLVANIKGLGGGNEVSKGTSKSKQKYNKKATHQLMNFLEENAEHGEDSSYSFKKIDGCLMNGADPNKRNKQGVLAITLATRTLDNHNIDALIKAGANPGLNKGIVLAYMNDMRQYPKYRNLKQLEKFYEHGADISWTNSDNENLADKAIELRLDNVFKWLLSLDVIPKSRRCLDMLDSTKCAPSSPIWYQYQDMKRALESHKSASEMKKVESKGDTKDILNLALNQNDWDRVNVLLEGGAKVDFEMLKGILQSCYLLLRAKKAIPSSAFKAASTIIRMGVDVNSKSGSRTLLDEAISEVRWHDNTSIILFLLENGARPTVTNFIDVFWNVQQGVSEEIATVMIKANFDVNDIDSGKSVLDRGISSDRAPRSAHLVFFLLQNGAHPSLNNFIQVISTYSREVAEPIALGMIYQLGANLSDNSGTTIVCHAAHKQLWMVVDTLLRNGADYHDIPRSSFKLLPPIMQNNLLLLFLNDESFMAHVESLINKICTMLSNEITKEIETAHKMDDLRSIIREALKYSTWTLRFYDDNEQELLLRQEFIKDLSSYLNQLLGKKMYFDQERNILNMQEIAAELKEAISLFNVKHQEQKRRLDNKLAEKKARKAEKEGRRALETY